MYSEHAPTQAFGFTSSHRQSTLDPPTYPHNCSIIHKITCVFHKERERRRPPDPGGRLECDSHRRMLAAGALLFLPFVLFVIVDIQGVDEIAEERKTLIGCGVSFWFISLSRPC